MQMLTGDPPNLMDGALGTELERRGLPIEEQGWSAMALQQHGVIVQSIHEDYLRAGSVIHIVNSFALARHVLKPVGLAERLEWMNRQSVNLFDRAVSATGLDRNGLWAAGSISTFSANSDRSKLPKSRELLKNYQEQAGVLVDAGIDLFALEMLFDVDLSLTMLEAVEPFGLPLILGLTCEWDREGNKDQVVTRSLDGVSRSLGEVLNELLGCCRHHKIIPAIMHSDIDVTHAALGILRQQFNAPVAAYPNSGSFSNLRMNFDSVCSPREFANASIDWIQEGVSIVGGCCGIGPKHIAELRTRLISK